MTFRVLHVKNSEASLECAVDHSATHVKWHVSSLSPVGPVIQSEETLYHHGAVILYKVIDQNPSLSFRVYIATNNESFIKDIAKAVKHSSKKFMKIDKPPVCLKLLENGKKYRLVSEPEADITPERATKPAGGQLGGDQASREAVGGQPGQQGGSWGQSGRQGDSWGVTRQAGRGRGVRSQQSHRDQA
ncbi:hypothetical protein MDA_GLEAN10017666 [Myotis davidii]|uniref:FIIND domain-containing protein n=1 Tax=Myotis davidii TaxID=225400 RepID=L5MHC0_MYODS|nr:hypothetical protein MDA_GLEAN10017666 [Myotis davidii]